MMWLQLGGSLIAVLLLAGIAWALRLGRDGKIDSPEAAADAVEHAIAGFHVENAVVGTDGQGALAVGDGRVAVVKRHGARLVVREVSWRAVQCTPAGVLIDPGERRFGTVRLAGVDALHVRRLAPQLTRV